MRSPGWNEVEPWVGRQLNSGCPGKGDVLRPAGTPKIKVPPLPNVPLRSTLGCGYSAASRLIRSLHDFYLAFIQPVELIDQPIDLPVHARDLAFELRAVPKWRSHDVPAAQGGVRRTKPWVSKEIKFP